MAKIVKYIYSEESVWEWTTQAPYRKLKQLFDIKWNIIVQIDPMNPDNNIINL